MTESPGELYGTGARAMQDHFDARRLADRLNEVTVSTSIDDQTAAYLERASYFFLATVDGEGFPDVSYKGGRPGFVKVLDHRTLRFPSYDGNGMYRSLGSIQETSNVALLFIRQNAKANRIRIHGTASILLDEAALAAARMASPTDPGGVKLPRIPVALATTSRSRSAMLGRAIAARSRSAMSFLSVAAICC